MDSAYSKITDMPPLIKDENGNKSDVDEFGSISAFYRDSTIFVTGVTGFLGHVLLCKLLSSCADIRKIYILMREKRDRTVNERFQELLNESVFDKLKADRPNFVEKIQPIKGDCLEPNLGIGENERAILQAEVNVIFHVAATVRFDAPLKTAVNINVRSTKDLLDMARSMEKLKAFVHVSTAFSFCAGRNVIEEKLYTSPLPASSLMKVVEELDDAVIDQITPALLQNHPNTYVFTKAISESLFSAKSLDLPTAIFRPAIVISTANEPIPGWINNTYGPTGIVAAAGLGLMRTLHCDKDCKANVVPCDYVINALIASAWYTAKRWRLLKSHEGKAQNGLPFSNDVPIFNYSSSESKKSLTWKEFMYENEIVEPETPFYQSLWAYSLTLNKYKLMDQVYSFFLHSIPAHLIDTGGAICRKKSNLVESYKKIRKLASVISYFSTRDWTIPNKRVQNMWNMLSDEDKRNFNFDLETINWKEYFRHHMIGIRQFILQDTPDTIPKAVKKRKKLVFMHYSLLLIILGFFIFCINAFFHYFNLVS